MGFVETLIEVLIHKILLKTLLGNQKDLLDMVLHIVFVGLTMVWQWRLHPRIAPGLGKSFGGLAVGLLTLYIMFTLAALLVNMLVKFGITMMFSGVRNIPAVGDKLADVLEGFVLTIVSIVVPFIIGIYVIKNLLSVTQKAGNHLEGSVKGWQGDGPGGVKLTYSLAATFIVAGVLNRPELNPYYILSIPSACLGIYSLFKGTKVAESGMLNLKARISGKPRESDGAWQCPNKLKVPVVVKGKPLLNPDGTPKLVEKACEGPGGSYGGWNPKEAPHCLKCSHPNPYWTTCPNKACGFKGTDGKGFPRADGVCPKCFTPVDAPAATTASTPAPAPNETPTTSGKVCGSCGVSNDADAQYCENCGGQLSQPTQPSVTPVAPSTTVPVSFGNRYQPTALFPERWL